MKNLSRAAAFLFRSLAVLAGCVAFAASSALAQNAGNVDPALDPGVGPSNPIYALAVQPDGKIVIGGNFYYLDGYTVNGFARLNGDGSVDFSFNPGNGANGPIFAVALQADGKVLIGGAFTYINGYPRNGLARLNADGSVDTSFGFLAGANNSVRGIAIQPDGKILVGGDFTSFNNYPFSRIARLSSVDGSLDFSFNPGYGASSSVGPIAVQPDGKIVVGGNFLFFNGYASSGVTRLLSNGAVDTSFGASVGYFPATNNYVAALLLQPDGKIVVGGGFTAIGGVGRNAVARLNADGTVDGSFYDPAGGPDGGVLALGRQPDGKIIIGGEFTGVDGIEGGSIARLGSNGVLDVSYGPGFPANGAIIALQLLNNGETVAGGAFTYIGGAFRPFLARLFQDPTANPTDVRYIRLLSLNSKEFAANAPLNLVVEGYSPSDPIASITFYNNDAVIFQASAAKGDFAMPKARASAERGPIRRAAAPFQQSFQAVIASLSEGLNNLKAVATTRAGAQLSSNTSATMGASAAAAPAVTCQITSPQAGTLPAAGTPVQVVVTNAANPVTVEFYVDSAKGGQDQIPAVQPGGNATATFSLPDLSADRPHYLTAVVTDNATQISRQSAAVTLTAPGAELPSVVLDASVPEVTAGTGAVGEFTLTRAGGDVSQEIVVNYTIKGSAAPGVDYVALKGSKKMKAGKESVKIKVAPLGAAGGVKRVVKLTLAPGDGYTVGSDKPAKVKIFGQ